MLRAELHGKLPRDARRLEDLLTSYVFGYLELADRQVLRQYLGDVLGIEISRAEAEAAEFTFWPIYTDGTEPDLVIEAGDWYLLVEAKLHSGFGQDRGDEEKNQLRRELRGGSAAAEFAGRTFRLVTITAEPFCDPRRYDDIRGNDVDRWLWTNWQRFTEFLDGMNAGDRGRHGEQLRAVLYKRGLRGFRGFSLLEEAPAAPDTLFWGSVTARSAGRFIGFQHALRGLAVPEGTRRVFWAPGDKFRFRGHAAPRQTKSIFWERGG